MKNLDLFRKLSEETRQQTFLGGFMTLISVSVIIILFFSEFYLFISHEIIKEILIDFTDVNKNVNFTIDIYLPKSPCFIITVDIQDVIGSFSSNSRLISKQRIDITGKIIADD